MCSAVRCILTCTYHLAQNEGMTGVISTNGVFSRLTFALYEDSGCVIVALQLEIDTSLVVQLMLKRYHAAMWCSIFKMWSSAVLLHPFTL